MVACHGEDTFVDLFIQIYKEDSKILQLNQKKTKAVPAYRKKKKKKATVLSNDANDAKKARPG